jgi:hypothetical protein
MLSSDKIVDNMKKALLKSSSLLSLTHKYFNYLSATFMSALFASRSATVFSLSLLRSYNRWGNPVLHTKQT